MFLADNVYEEGLISVPEEYRISNNDINWVREQFSNDSEQYTNVSVSRLNDYTVKLSRTAAKENAEEGNGRAANRLEAKRDLTANGYICH